MMRGSLGCSSVVKSEIRKNTRMVQLMDGDGATNPEEDIGIESVKRVNVWDRGLWDCGSTG